MAAALLEETNKHRTNIEADDEAGAEDGGSGVAGGAGASSVNGGVDEVTQFERIIKSAEIKRANAAFKKLPERAKAAVMQRLNVSESIGTGPQPSNESQLGGGTAMEAGLAHQYPADHLEEVLANVAAVPGFVDVSNISGAPASFAAATATHDVFIQCWSKSVVLTHTAFANLEQQQGQPGVQTQNRNLAYNV